MQIESSPKKSPKGFFIKKVSRKHAANLQENTHVDVQFQSIDHFLYFSCFLKVYSENKLIKNV